MFIKTPCRRVVFTFFLVAVIMFNSAPGNSRAHEKSEGIVGHARIQQEQKFSQSANPVVGAWRAGPSQLSTGDRTWALDYTTGGQVIVFSATGPQTGYYCKVGVQKDRKNPFASPLLRDPSRWKEVPRVDWLDAKAYLYDTFYANCGTYTIAGQTITRQREFTSNQLLVGVSIAEEFQIEGDTMITISKEPWWIDPSKTLTTTIVYTRIN